MITVKCQSKNPSQCRYHAPDASEVARRNLAVANLNLAGKQLAMQRGESVSYSELSYAQGEADRALEIYEATPEGVDELFAKHEAAEKGSSEWFDIGFRLDMAAARVIENEAKTTLDAQYGGSLIPSEESTYKLPGYVSSGDSLWPVTTGEKYDPDLSTRQIATNLSADFKRAQKEGYLPKHLKFKVSPNSARGRISMTIMGAGDVQVWEDNSNGFSTFTPDARELYDRANIIFGAYRKVQSDTVEGRTNSTNYWGIIEFESEADKRRREDKAANKK